MARSKIIRADCELTDKGKAYRAARCKGLCMCGTPTILNMTKCLLCADRFNHHQRARKARALRI